VRRCPGVRRRPGGQSHQVVCVAENDVAIDRRRTTSVHLRRLNLRPTSLTDTIVYFIYRLHFTIHRVCDLWWDAFCAKGWGQPFPWFLADRINGRAYDTLLRPSVVCRLSSVTLCTVAKRCVLEQKLLLTTIGRIWEIDWYQIERSWLLFGGR